MGTIKTRTAKKKKSLCRTYRSIGLEIEKPALDEWAMARVVREAVKKYRLTTITIAEVMQFIEDEMLKLPSISAVTTNNQIKQAEEMVGRYLDFDDRRLFDAYAKEFIFEGETLKVNPDYWYESSTQTKYTEGKLPVVEVITVSAGRPTFGDTKQSRGGSSVYHNLETLGNLLYGKSILNGREGVVRVVYDWLKTSYDKYGNYSKPFSEAVEGKFTKGGDNNRLVFEVPFDENGDIISAFNPRLDKLMDNYKVSLQAHVNGICAEEVSKGTCEECEYYDRCKGYSKRPEPKAEDVKAAKPMTRDDFDISAEQELVIGAREGIYCVDAGPGSGKTFSVSLRIADMIVEGASPEDFLLLSFSKAAVKVMKERVDYFLNEVYQMNVDVSDMMIATFHSLANEIVQENYKLLGFSSEPQLIDDIEAIDLVRQAIDWSKPIDGFDYTNPLMQFGAGGVVPNLYKLFSDIKAFNLDRGGFDTKYSYPDEVKDELWDTFQRYRQLMIDNNFLDYNDMEILVEKLINEDQNLVTDKVNYSHIIVDEFQDSNDFQMLFVNCLSLAPKFCSLVVIGDPNQAIYNFRGTSPENFIHFDDKMGLDDVTDLTLTINRRSTPEIVELSNQIISLNREPNTKIMISANPSLGQDVLFKDFEVGSAELPWVATKIKELISNGANPSDIAFISHKKSTLTRLQGLLSEEGVLALFDQPEELLSDSKFCSLVVIGDPNQAIYNFRGTSPENFIHFDDKMGLDDVTDLTLTINRRSTPEIVELSNQIISLNREPNTKIMISANPSLGQDVLFKDFEVGSAELPWVATKIKELISNGANPSDIAFISHKKSTLTRLQGLLSEEGVLALFDQPEELLSDSKVKAIISLVMFLRDTTATKGVFDYLCELLGNSFMNEPDAQKRVEEEAEELVSMLDDFSLSDKKECLLNLIRGLRDESDSLYESFVERIEGKTNYSYYQLLDYIYKFDKYSSGATAEKDAEYEAVALVTAHSSKGKEWKNVFVSLSDFDSGLLTRAEMPEKIRLSYVACTRAEESLTITCAKYRKTEGDTKPINRFWRCFDILPGAVKVGANNKAS